MNFNEVYDQMTQCYLELEKIMGDMYQANDNKNNENIQMLGSLAKNMITSQMSFTEGYADSSNKELLMSNLESKYYNLSNELEKEKHVR